MSTPTRIRLMRPWRYDPPKHDPPGLRTWLRHRLTCDCCNEGQAPWHVWRRRTWSLYAVTYTHVMRPGYDPRSGDDEAPIARIASGVSVAIPGRRWLTYHPALGGWLDRRYERQYRRAVEPYRAAGSSREDP